MKRMKLIIGIPLTVGLTIGTLFFWNSQKTGRVLDSYKSVPVYDNGLFFFRSYGKNYSADGYYFGQKWQCVEFIKRFYFQAKNHKMPDVMGHAKSFFDEDLADDTFNPQRGLFQHRNGSTEKPRPDDLMVFTDTTFGHVAIVTEVASNSLEVIQQNILCGTRQRFSLVANNGHYFVTSPRRPAGWMRKQNGEIVEVRDFPSPDRKYICTVFGESFHDTTGWPRHIDLHPANELHGYPGNVYVVPVGDDVKVSWTSPTNLSVRLSFETRRKVPSATNVAGVTVIFSEMVR